MATDGKKERLAASELRIERCNESDFQKIAEGLYVSFPDEFWTKWEPVSLRPPLESTRHTRLANRLVGSCSNPNMHWIKAVHVPTNEIMGVAGWMDPGLPLHHTWRRSATDFYNWKAERGWTDEDIEEMWSGTDLKPWEARFTQDDQTRRDVMGDEPHWYLVPLFTLPQFQGRGVGSALLRWATEQADKTDPVTPLYLESSQMARPVYMRHGFVPVGESNFVRRGPNASVEGGQVKDADAYAKADKDGVELTVKVLGEEVA